MKILSRYVVREHVGPLVFSLTALTALLLLNQVAKNFGDLVGKGLPWSVIGRFFLLTIPFIVAMTLPMAVLVAVLYAFSRLSAENEVTALKAGGVGIMRIVAPPLWGAAVLAVLMLAFNDQLLPRTNHTLRTLQTDIARKKPTFALREQVINEVSPGRLFLKAGHIDQASDLLREVTIYDLSDPTSRRTVYADSGRMALTPDHSDLQMILYTGYSQEVPRDNPADLQRLYFGVDHITIRGVGNQLELTGETDQYRSDREMSVCGLMGMFAERADDYQKARFDYRKAQVKASEGAEAAARVTPLPPPRLLVGQLYCSLLANVFQVKEAAAAELAARPVAMPAAAPPATPRQGISPKGKTVSQGTPARRKGAAQQIPLKGKAAAPGTSRTARPDSTGLPPAFRRSPALDRMLPVLRPAEPSPEAAASQLAVLKARVEDTQMGLARPQIETHKKFALAASCIVFVIFGAPIALRFPRGGVGLVLGVSLGAFGIYYIALIGGETLANKLILSPLVAMWMANALFTFLGVIMMARVGKSGATARGGEFAEMLENARLWMRRQAARVRGLPESHGNAA